AANARSLPVIIRQPMAGSASNTSSAAISSPINTLLSAFNSLGRFRRATPTRSRVSVRINVSPLMPRLRWLRPLRPCRFPLPRLPPRLLSLLPPCPRLLLPLHPPLLLLFLPSLPLCPLPRALLLFLPLPPLLRLLLPRLPLQLLPLRVPPLPPRLPRALL